MKTPPSPSSVPLVTLVGTLSRPLVLCAWVGVFLGALFWLKVPPADFDEALYAEMARLMILTGEYIQPMWDGRAMFDKPPVFMWTLLPFAENYHPGSLWPGFVRLANVVASLAVAGGVAWMILRQIRSTQGTTESTAVQCADIAKETALTTEHGNSLALTSFLFYFSGLLPFLGMGLLLIDLLLCLFLFPVFAILDRAFQRQSAPHLGTARLLTLGESVTVGLFIGLAAATKGLIAWIIPGLAVVAMSVWNKGTASWAQLLRNGIQSFWLVFVLAVAGTVAFYSWVWSQGHQDFVTSFFVDHHFGRGSNPMEGHEGSVLYHFVVVWIGGGWLTVALLAGLRTRLQSNAQRANTIPRLRNDDFALWWFLVTILFFSVVATKLPNYTWPVWMALPVVVVRLFAQAQAEIQTQAARSLDLSPARRGFGRGLALAHGGLVALYGILGVAFVILPWTLELMNTTGTGPLATFQALIDPRVLAIASGISFSASETMASTLAGLSFGVLAWLMAGVSTARPLFRQVPAVVLVQAILMVSIMRGVLPVAERAYLNPIMNMADRATRDHVSTDVVTFGIKSPSFSSTYRGQGTLTQVSWDSDYDKEVRGRALLVIPSWATRNCEDRSAETLATEKFLILCLKPETPAPPRG